MTDRTENNKVFDTKKIIFSAIACFIFNYVFVIGTRLIVVFQELPSGITKCYGVPVDGYYNGFNWTYIITAIYHLSVTICGTCSDLALNRYVWKCFETEKRI